MPQDKADDPESILGSYPDNWVKFTHERLPDIELILAKKHKVHTVIPERPTPVFPV